MNKEKRIYKVDYIEDCTNENSKPFFTKKEEMIIREMVHKIIGGIDIETLKTIFNYKVEVEDTKIKHKISLAVPENIKQNESLSESELLLSMKEELMSFLETKKTITSATALYWFVQEFFNKKENLYFGERVRFRYKHRVENFNSISMQIILGEEVLEMIIDYKDLNKK